MNDPQVLFNIAVAGAGALAMWILNGLKASLDALHKSDMELSNKVQSIELLVAGGYVKKDEMEKHSMAVLLKLDKIDAKLDTKVDKDHCNTLHFTRRDGDRE